VPYVKPLTHLNQCVAPLRAVGWRSLWWWERRAQKRRLRRAEKRRLRRALTEPIDIVEISAEAMFRFVALNFDPQHITFDEARALGHVLRDGGAIDRRTQIAFNRGIARLQRLLTPEPNDARVNLIAALDAYGEYPHESWRTRPNLSAAAEILRTIDIQRRELPPA